MRAPAWLAILAFLPACASAIPIPAGEPAGAEAESVFTRPGLYAGASALLGWEEFDRDVGGDEIGRQGTSGLGFRLGYRFEPHVAVELAWRDVEIDGSDVEGGFWDAVAQMKLLLGRKRYQPYLLLGLGMVQGTEGREKAGFAARFGLGMEAYLTERFGVFLEFSADAQAFGDASLPDDAENDDHLAVQVGVLLRF